MRVVFLLAIFLVGPAPAQTIHGKDGITLPAPPAVAKHPVTDTYMVAGAPDVQVTDDYRWLEDAKSPATRAYIAAQNTYTQLPRPLKVPRVRKE